MVEQPDPILKTSTKFTTTVRLLISEAAERTASIKLNQLRLTLRICNREQVHKLRNTPGIAPKDV